MRKTIKILAVLLALELMVLAAYLGIERAREGSIAVERLSRPAPELELFAPDGSLSRLSEFRGSVVVVHFWATWCPPCRRELPSLLRFAAAGDAEVLAVSVDPAWDTIRSFVGPEFHEHLYRASGETVSRVFGVDELPQTFVIDPSGTSRLHFRGPRDWSSSRLREMIAALDRADVGLAVPRNGP